MASGALARSTEALLTARTLPHDTYTRTRGLAQSRVITLRQDQLDLVSDARHAMRDHQSVLFQAAPGFGKTVAAAYIAKSVQDKGKRAIFAVHRKELLYQTAKTFF